MRRAVLLATVLVATFSAPLDAAVADPISDFMQQHGSGQRPLTAAEWCELALLEMASRYANEQTRMALNEMSRSRGCYEAPQAQAQAQPSLDEQARVAVCRTIPDLLFQPGMTKAQKLDVMKIAKANGCIR
jgi:hypothetical protein